MGRLAWLFSANDLPVILKLEIVTGEALKLTRDTFDVAVLPTTTEPKLRLPGEICRDPEDAPEIIPPLQPESARTNKGMTTSSAAKRHPFDRVIFERL